MLGEPDMTDPQQPGPWPGQPPPQVGPAPVPAANSGQSIVSLVLGIVGLLTSWIVVGLAFAIPAVVLGHLSWKRASKQNQLALAGLVLGWIAMGLSILFIIIYIAAAHHRNCTDYSLGGTVITQVCE
jgi:Domain of unknown function (DUF4190)